MTTILCISLVICGVLMMFNCIKTAFCFGAFVLVACFGYRYWIGGEELRSVIADAMFCLTLLPIGWWAAKSFHQLAELDQLQTESQGSN